VRSFLEDIRCTRRDRQIVCRGIRFSQKTDLFDWMQGGSLPGRCPQTARADADDPGVPGVSDPCHVVKCKKSAIFAKIGTPGSENITLMVQWRCEGISVARFRLNDRGSARQPRTRAEYPASAAGRSGARGRDCLPWPGDGLNRDIGRYRTARKER